MKLSNQRDDDGIDRVQSDQQMKVFDLTNNSRPHVMWPEEPTNEHQLFSGRRPFRKLVVMVDAELIVEDKSTNGEFSDEEHLTSLLSSPLISSFLYADDGPPADVQSVKHPRTDRDVYPGWIVLDGRSVEGNWVATYSDKKDSYSMSGVYGNAPTIAFTDTTTDAYVHLNPEEAAKRRHDDVLAANVAMQGLGADIHVSNRQFLKKRGGYATRGVTICTPREAVALIGLYLRSQGDFSIVHRFNFNRGLFYWVGMRELLPEAWRWFNACAQHSAAVGDDSLMLLSGSLLQRVDRALETRDHVLIALNQPQNNDLRDDALSALDVILVSFMAAIDVSARVTHRVLGITGDEYKAAWQNKRRGGWWRAVDSVDSQLASVVADGSRGDNVLSIVRLLRNSVHGAALQGIAYVQSGSPQQTLVGLPVSDEAELLAAMDRLGGRDAWGAQTTIPGRTHVDPGSVVENLFELVPALLNELMEKTPVERLSHVILSDEIAGPPTGGQSNPFEPWIRQSIRRLLGF
jgi:hypothetical protein